MTRSIRWSTPTLLVLAAAAALAVPGFAAQPRTNDCWGGDCNSTASSAGFEAAGHVVYGLVIPELCLGSTGHGSHRYADFLEGFKDMQIHASGAFSTPGQQTVTIENGAETMQTSTTVANVHGKFVTPNKAEISLTIHYRSCATKHVTILGHHR